MSRRISARAPRASAGPVDRPYRVGDGRQGHRAARRWCREPGQSPRGACVRPEMGTLLAIETANTVVMAIVSALSVPVPGQREGESELWIAELGLVGELWRTPTAARAPSTAAFRPIRRSATGCGWPRARSSSRHSAAIGAARSGSAASGRIPRSRPPSASTSCSASTSPSSARRAPANPARRR